ncbi:hypothetical protein MJD09_13515, partial [bacterium]|nr:hypothetical protein [bacterium]
MKKYLLEYGWCLRPQAATSKQVPEAGIAACVPGTVHTDLLAAGLIPDPFEGDNEKNMQWIHEQDWLYELHFHRPSRFSGAEPIFLTFEGLDTVAEIILNGETLAKTENMFRRYRFQVDQLLQQTENHLQITFRSPAQTARQMEKERGKLPVALNSERVYLRKAQYAFGWDWGPFFPTMGIWRPVYLHQPGPAWIEAVNFDTLAISEGVADVRIDILLEPTIAEKWQVAVELRAGTKKVAMTNMPVSDPSCRT